MEGKDIKKYEGQTVSIHLKHDDVGPYRGIIHKGICYNVFLDDLGHNEYVAKAIPFPLEKISELKVVEARNLEKSVALALASSKQETTITLPIEHHL